MTSDRIIITGGHGHLASSIAARFSLHIPTPTILTPSHNELDVTDSKNIAAYFTQHPSSLLVCCAGASYNNLIAKTSSAEWDECLHTHLRGAALCAAAASKNMLRERCGHIIFISSFSAYYPPIGQMAYSAAKAGLLGLSKSLARELGSANIRVNTILPGFIDSPMTNPLSHARKAQVLADHTLERLNTAAQTADFIHHLHYHLPHTSGQIFNLDSRII